MFYCFRGASDKFKTLIGTVSVDNWFCSFCFGFNFLSLTLYTEEGKIVYLIVIKPFGHLKMNKTRKECRAQSPSVRAFYTSLVFLNAHRVL